MNRDPDWIESLVDRYHDLIHRILERHSSGEKREAELHLPSSRKAPAAVAAADQAVPRAELAR